MGYKFKFKKKWFWRTVSVSGHQYNQDQDKMILYKKDGGIEEVPNWKQCSVKLGADWVIAVQKNVEKESGRSIPLNKEA